MLSSSLPPISSEISPRYAQGDGANPAAALGKGGEIEL
jgi:hypothetical protein